VGSDTSRHDELGVVVNGEPCSLAPGTTVADVVTARCESSTGVAVARNREVVPRSAWATTPLGAGDRVEILSAVAGG
jgi:sulfur carrier protein